MNSERFTRSPRKAGSVTPLRVSVSAERGLAYWPAMRPTRMMGFLSPCSSTRLICSRILSFLAICVGLALFEGLGAVAAHEQELVAALRFGEVFTELFDFPRHHQRRQSRELRGHALELGNIGVTRLLLRRAGGPACRMPGGGVGGTHVANYSNSGGYGTLPPNRGFHAQSFDPGCRQDRRAHQWAVGRIRRLRGHAG